MICLIDMICLIVHPTKGMMIPINEPFWCRKSCRSTWIPHPPRRWETFFADEMEDPQFQDSRYKSARNGLYYENYIYIYICIHMYIYDNYVYIYNMWYVYEYGTCWEFQGPRDKSWSLRGEDAQRVRRDQRVQRGQGDSRAPWLSIFWPFEFS